MDAGDALIAAQSRVSTNWKRWLRDNCFLSVRTAQLYTQLARHRSEIEAEIDRIGMLGLRAACRLIAPPKAPEPKVKKLIPDLLVAWNKATAAERTKALGRIQLADFLQAMPATWRTELKARGAHPGEGKADDPITKAIRKALSHLVVADPASLAAQEHEALAALRAANSKLRAAGCDLHDITISVSGRRKRAA
jgi:hypothetical protein